MVVQSARKPRQEERQKKVAELYYVQGHTEAYIARTLSISRKTVVRDLQCLKMSQIEHLTPEFARTLVARMTARMEFLVSGVMQEYPNLKTKEKIFAGGVASRIIKEQMELYEKLGILDLAKTPIEVLKAPEEQTKMDLMVDEILKQWEAKLPQKPEGID